jgi:hypothetical protein
MKKSKINRLQLITTMHRRIAGIAIIVSSVFYISSLLSGCQYTIDGNPDVDLTEVHISPVSAVVVLNSKMVLNASVLGFSNTGSVTWSVDGGGNNGSITPNGSSAIYQAPPVLTSLHQVATVTVTSNEDASRSVICLISIIRPIDTAFSISPSSDTLLTNSTQQFLIDTITVQSVIPPLRWEIVSGSGSISDSGLYTAPSSIPNDGVQTVIRAVSRTDSTIYGESKITLLNSSDSLLCFTRDILPVLSANCGISGCHDANSGKGGLNCTTYSGTERSTRPGDARSSRLYTAITQFNENSRMPPSPAPALSPSDVLKIGKWIDEGAMDCQ